MRVCGHLSCCPSVCYVFMRVRGHLRVCAVCVRERVDMYVQVCVITVMLMCTIFILTIIAQFGMDIQYIMIWKVWYCFLQFHAGL